MPLDWSLVVGDESCASDPEVLPLTSLNERGFDALTINPIKGYRCEFMPIEIVNVYQEVKWYFPKIKNNQLLTIPLQDKHNPDCAFFVKEISRQCETIQLENLL